MWNFHEHVRGELVWSGRRDLALFLKTAQAHGLNAVVRIGPYVCGEYYFGGIPVWVRSLQDNNNNVIQCFRCSDPLWEEYMERWTRQVVQQVEPLLASNGGPIVMMQIENEYNKDLGYQNWAVQMARNIRIINVRIQR